MFKVECPGCNAPYQVDERRVPSSGLRMRCPKCGTSFKVDAPSAERAVDPKAGAGSSPNVGLPARVPRNSPLKSTMLGVSPPLSGGAPKAAEPARTLSGAYGEVDLPTVGGASARVRPTPPAAPLPAPLAPAAPPAAPPPQPIATDVDLPAPLRTAPHEADLPVAAPARPPPPVRHRAPPAPAPPGSPSEEFGEIDLPAALAPPRRASQAAIEADLPMVGARARDVRNVDVDLPSRPRTDLPSRPRAEAPSRARVPDRSDIGEVDLPSRPEAKAPSRPEAKAPSRPRVEPPPVIPDLPTVSGARAPGGFGEVDLPVPRGGPAQRPSAAKRRLLEGDSDLPAALDFGGLPSPGAELPSPAAGLPTPAAGLPTLAAGLPTPAAGLPTPAAGLPSPATAGLPSPSASLPSPAAGLPKLAVASEASWEPPGSEFELEPTGALSAPPVSAPGSAGAPESRSPFSGSPLRLADHDHFGELELPTGSPSAPSAAAPGDLEADFGAPIALRAAPQQSAYSLSEPAVVRQAGGGVSYGEVNLDGGDGMAAEAPPAVSDDMEFGAIPEEPKARPRVPAPEVAESAPVLKGVPATATAAAPPVSIRARKPKRRGLKIFAAIAALVAIGGGALALVPAVGPFGAYWIVDQLKGGEYRQLVASASAQARAKMAADTYPDAKRALEGLDAALARAKRVEALSAYTAFTAYARDLRFGPEPEVRARAQVLLDELNEAKRIEHLELARAAQAISGGQLARARQDLQRLSSADPRSIDVLVLKGELELRAREPAAALTAWSAAAKVEASARTAFGLARAKDAAGDVPGALAAAADALKRNPRHVGARILTARLASTDKSSESEQALEAVVKDPSQASPEEIVSAETLLGEYHLRRSRISKAEAAYGEALKIDPKAARALVGLGDVLYRAGRYSEALARFQAAVQADPDDVTAKVGVARAKLALEALSDAVSMLKSLRDAHAESTLVAYWYGRALEAAGDRKQAEDAYRATIALGKSDPDAVASYIALSQLLDQSGRSTEAQKVLNDARKALADSARLHSGLGDLALAQGRHADAVKEFRAALAADPDDVGAQFRLGVALRRNREFPEAQKHFDAVYGIDPDYPGLALERGLLFEASGHAEEALKSYESALAKAPNDPDLMLRVGCGKIAAGRVEQASELLRRVMAERPNSAEANHCLGRALLLEGKNLAEALRILERATELDSNRAEYWLYVGWAANEAGRVSKAEEALRKALDLDQSLADAYWQRGVLRGRQGAVRDAVKDLVRALELRPSRFEAHAALADAYDELGQETEAMSEWDKAVSAQPDNPVWQFRYGKLLAANHRNDAAREHLTRALELGEALDPKPIWLPEAHLQMARAIGMRPEAVKHWEAFLSSGARDSAYRDEAKETLKKLGHRWEGD